MTMFFVLHLSIVACHYLVITYDISIHFLARHFTSLVLYAFCLIYKTRSECSEQSQAYKIWGHGWRLQGQQRSPAHGHVGEQEPARQQVDPLDS